MRGSPRQQKACHPLLHSRHTHRDRPVPEWNPAGVQQSIDIGSWAGYSQSSAGEE